MGFIDDILDRSDRAETFRHFARRSDLLQMQQSLSLGWVNITEPHGIFLGAVAQPGVDNTARIQAAIDQLPTAGNTRGGIVYFPPAANDYECASGLVANRANGKGSGVIFLGAGGVVNTWGGNPSMASSLTYTGGGAVRFMDVRSTHGFRFVNMQVAYSGVTYSGRLIDWAHDASGVDSAYGGVFDCSITGKTGVSAKCLISWDQAILMRAVGGRIGGAQEGIRGIDLLTYSNAHAIDRVTFDHCTTAGILNAGQSWTVSASWFEGTGPSSLTRAYLDDRVAVTITHTLTFENVWCGDKPFVADPWFDFGNSEVRSPCFTGMFITGGSGSAMVFRKGGFGVKIHGYFEAPIDFGNFQTGAGIFDGVELRGGPMPLPLNKDSGHRGLDMVGLAGAGGDNLQPSGRLHILGHLIGGRARSLNPAIAAGPQAGAAPVVLILGEGTDLVISIRVQPGAGTVAGHLATITLAEAMGFLVFTQLRPKVTFGPRSAVAQALGVFNDATGGATINVKVANAPVAGTIYEWDIHIVGGP